MSKLPSVDGKRAVSAIENNGFIVVHISGSHHIMKKPEHRFLLSVPIHGKKRLKRGLLNGLLSAAGKTVPGRLELTRTAGCNSVSLGLWKPLSVNCALPLPSLESGTI